MRILLDGMGGDNAPNLIVEGAVMARREVPEDVEIMLVGKEDLLREALKEAKAQYGDNGEEVAKWEQKLNNARTTLANMKNDLDGTGTSLRGISTDAAAATVAAQVISAKSSSAVIAVIAISFISFLM